MISIAIDGPAGAGKSTISKAVAKQLGYIYVDTGALYRAIGLCALYKKVSTDSPKEILSLLDSLLVDLRFKNGEQHVYVNDNDVSDKIRTAEVSMAASNVSAIAEVRKFLFNLQQSIAEKNNVVMDGRDIGTVVLPNAQVKIFLTASPEIRAERRYLEMKEKGMSVKFDDVLNDLLKRDYNDSHRKEAPLKPAIDSVVADTSGKSLDESVVYILKIINEHLN